MIGRKFRVVIVTLVFLVVVGSIGFLGNAYEGGIFDQYEKGCTCHPLTPIVPEAQVSILGLPAQYTPDQTYTLRIVLTGGPTAGSGGNNAEGGFNLNVSAGTLAPPGGPPRVQVNVWGNQSTHTTQGNDQREWDVEWTAPGVGTGDVNFTVTALAADGDGSNVGDAWARFTVIVPEAGPVLPPTVDVIYPDGGEDLTGGSPHGIAYEPISMSFPNDQLLIWINYSLDGGTSFAPIPGAQGIPGTLDHPNVFPWTLPVEDSTQARVKVEVKDPAGLMGWDVSAADFEIDSTAPAVPSASPEGTDVVITENVRVDFSEPMNQTSAESAFSLADTVTWTYLSGTFLPWVINSLVFDPDPLLQPGTEYMANISMTAKDDSDPGNSLLVLHNWTFTTMSGADLEPPTISDVTAVPRSQEIGDNVNISAVIQDNVGVDHAWVNVTLPGGGFLEDPMDHDVANDRYYVNRSYPELGTYDFTVWAEDTSGLQNSSAGQFDIVDTTPPDIAHVPVSLALANDTINITVTVTDNFGLAAVDPVKLYYVNVTGIPSNITMLSIGGDDYQGQIPAQLVAGDVKYFVWAADSSGNEIRTSWYTITVVTQDTFPPEILNVQAVPSPQERHGSVNISATIRDLSGINLTWVNVEFPDTSTVNLTLSQGANDVYYLEQAYGQVGTYQLIVGATDVNGNANFSDSGFFIIEDTTPPGKPTGLSVATGDEAGVLDITWTANTEDDLAGYDLYRSDSVDGTYTKVNTAKITGTTYTDTGLEDNTTYWYKLKAVDDQDLESEYSDPASATTSAAGEEEEADYMWLYALLAILIILVIILAVASAMRKKPPDEEEELEELEEVGEEYTSEEGEEAAEEETVKVY